MTIRSIKTQKPICIHHQVIYDREAGESGQIAQWNIPPLRPVSTGKNIGATSFESLEFGIRQTFDSLIDAVEIDLDALAQSGFGQPQSVPKTGCFWRGSEE